MNFKQAAMKLVSCDLETEEAEDPDELPEAIAWAVWALMEHVDPE